MRMSKANKQEINFSQDCKPAISEGPNVVNLIKRNNGEFSKITSLYIVFYVETGVLKGVSKETFKKVKGKYMTVGEKKVKIYSSRKFKKYHLEGMIGDISNFITGVEIFINVMKKLGEIKNNLPVIQKRILHIIRILLDLKRMISSRVSLEDLVSLLVSLYLAKQDFNLESLDSLLLAGLSFAIPTNLFDLIKRMQMFSAAKIADDITMLHKFIVVILDLVRSLMKSVKLPEVFVGWFDKFVNSIGMLTHHVILKDMENALSITAKTPQILAKPDFRTKLDKLNDAVSRCDSLVEWSRRSESVRRITAAFTRLYVVSKQYDHISRQEPACFIFEGPPGCMKSVLMSKVAKALDEPVYSHIVPDAKAGGKDFYDNYQNQDVVCMDDIGQEGLSQWRTIINMVSGIVLPLDCARAELKDTKFFTSTKLLLTTNNFKNLTLRTDCGISDLQALHRRGYVFNMSQIHRNLATGCLNGSVTFEFYNLNTQKFEVGFPMECKLNMLKMMPSITPEFFFKKGENMDRLVHWVVLIVKMIAKIKKEFAERNIVELSNKDQIEKDIKFIDDYKCESGQEELYEQMRDSEQEESYEQLMSDLHSIPRVKFTHRSLVFARTETVSEEDFLHFCRMYRMTCASGEIPPLEISKKEGGIAFKSFISYLKGKEDEGLWEDSPHYWKEYMVSLFKDLVEFVVGFILDLGSGTIKNDVWSIATFVVIVVVISVIVEYFIHKKSYKVEHKLESFVKVFRDNDVTKLTTPLQAIQKNMFMVTLSDGKIENSCYATFSGRKFLVPNHLLLHNPKYVTVYKNFENKHILIDHEVFTMVNRDVSNDVAILALRDSYPVPFKNISHFFDSVLDHGQDVLINADGYVEVNNIRLPGLAPKVFKYDKFSINLGETLKYDLRGPRMCGTLLINNSGKIKGMHILGSETTGEGVSIIWPVGISSFISDFLKDRNPVIQYDISNKILNDFSGIKLDADFKIFSPNKSDIVKSPLHDIYPVMREPAKLMKYGRHTIKDIAKKSFKPVKDVDCEEMFFATKVVSSIIEPFDDISWSEVVQGNEFLAPLNKDSSNGFNCKKDKKDYVDFERGELLPHTLDELNDWNYKVENLFGQEYIPPEVLNKFVWCEALKDEVRSLSKDGEPRSFRVATIYAQLFTKKIFGNMILQLMGSRDFHQIMIGCNPYKEWNDISAKLSNCKRIWAGDIAKWDGSMLPQVQRAIADIFIAKYKGKYKEMIKHLLEHSMHSIVAINDDVYMTTHSMPSGSYLTAMLNSLVNKFYTAMWFYRECKNNGIKATVQNFWSEVVDFVYGDDKVNGIKSFTFLNAVNMRDFFVSIGMDFTDSRKNKIVSPGQDITEITFLKRSFVFHPLLERVMCPLDWDTLSSSLSWVDSKKDVDVVMADKIHNFQRELFLYPSFGFDIKQFYKLLDDRNYSYTKLPLSYLTDLYNYNLDDFIYF